MDPDKTSSQSDLYKSHIDEPTQSGDNILFPTASEDLQESSIDEPMQRREDNSSQTAIQEVCKITISKRHSKIYTQYIIHVYDV